MLGRGDELHPMLISVTPLRPADVLRMSALAVFYVLLARAGLALDAVGGFATVVWAPTGWTPR